MWGYNAYKGFGNASHMEAFNFAQSLPIIGSLMYGYSSIGYIICSRISDSFVIQFSQKTHGRQIQSLQVDLVGLCHRGHLHRDQRVLVLPGKDHQTFNYTKNITFYYYKDNIAMAVLTIIYYASLPFTTIVSHICNFQMLESLQVFKNFLLEPKTKKINIKNQILFRVCVTLILLLPVLFGKNNQN